MMQIKTVLKLITYPKIILNFIWMIQMFTRVNKIFYRVLKLEVWKVAEASKITNEFFGVIQVLGFNNLMTNIALFWCLKKKELLVES